jgi:hypothetical protein
MAARKRRKSPPRKQAPRRKNVYIDQSSLDEARRIIKAESETQTLAEALDSIIFAQEMIDGLRAVRDAGGVDYFDKRDRPNKRR